MANVVGDDFIVGIDLGSSNSSVSVYRFGRPDVIANYLGERVTPSIVYFDPNATLKNPENQQEEILVGKSAGERALRYPQNVVFGSKRMLGRLYKDDVIQEDVLAWPYKVIESSTGMPLVEVQHAKDENDRNQSQTTYYTAEQIGGYIIKDLIKTASEYLGEPIKKAVITVPANFNSKQRSATLTAAEHAGIDVIKLLNEPTAAAFAYGFQSSLLGKRGNALIYDFGGGTLDVTLMHCENGVFKVLGTEGDTHLGGQDFDGALLEFVFQKFRKQTAIAPAFGKDKKSAQTLRKLRNDVERAKCDLSTSKETYVTMIYNSHEEVIDISRTEFEKCCAKLLERCLEPVKSLLNRIKFSPDDIDEIILVGGSTRIPRVQQQLTQHFSQFRDGRKTLSKSINPDEAVSIGASLQAAILSKSKHQTIVGTDGKETIRIHDVIPLSIGIKTRANTCDIIVQRNTVLPVVGAFIEAPLSSFHIDNNHLVVLEGEVDAGGDIKDLIETSRLDLSTILAKSNNPNQMVKIQMDIDINGTLKPKLTLSSQATLPPAPPLQQTIPLTFHTINHYISLTSVSGHDNDAGNGVNAFFSQGLGFLSNFTTKNNDEFNIMFDNNYNLTRNNRKYAHVVARVVDVQYEYEDKENKKLSKAIISFIDGTGQFELVIDTKVCKQFNERSLPNTGDVIELYLELKVDHVESKTVYILHTYNLLQSTTPLTNSNDPAYAAMLLTNHLKACKKFYLQHYLLLDYSLSDDVIYDMQHDTPFDIIPFLIKDLNTFIKPIDEYNTSKIFYNSTKEITHRLIRYYGVVFRVEPNCPDHPSTGCCRVMVNTNGVVNSGISPKIDTMDLHFNPTNKLTPPKLNSVLSIIECIVPDKQQRPTSFFGNNNTNNTIAAPPACHHKLTLTTTLVPGAMQSSNTLQAKQEFTSLTNQHIAASNEYIQQYCHFKTSIPRRIPPLRQTIPTTLHTFEHYLHNSTLTKPTLPQLPSPKNSSSGAGGQGDVKAAKRLSLFEIIPKTAYTALDLPHNDSNNLYGLDDPINDAESELHTDINNTNNNPATSPTHASKRLASIPNDHIIYGHFDLTKNSKNYTKIRVRVSSVDVIGRSVSLTIHDLTSWSVLTFKDGELGDDPQQYPMLGDIIDIYYELCITSSQKPIAKYFYCFTFYQREPHVTNGRQRTGSILPNSTSFNRSPSMGPGAQGGANRSTSVGRRPSVGRSPSLGPTTSGLSLNTPSNSGSNPTASPSIRDNILSGGGQLGSRRGSSLSPGVGNNFGSSPGLPRQGSGAFGTQLGSPQPQANPSLRDVYRDYTLILLEYFKLCEKFYNINNEYSIVLNAEGQVDHYLTENPFVIIPIKYSNLLHDLSYDESTSKAMLYGAKDVSHRLVQYIHDVHDVDPACSSCPAGQHCTKLQLVEEKDKDAKLDPKSFANPQYIHYPLFSPTTTNRIFTPEYIPSMIANIHLITPHHAVAWNNDKKNNPSSRPGFPSTFIASLSFTKEINPDDGDEFCGKLQALANIHHNLLATNFHSVHLDKKLLSLVDLTPRAVSDAFQQEAEKLRDHCAEHAATRAASRKTWGWW